MQEPWQFPVHVPAQCNVAPAFAVHSPLQVPAHAPVLSLMVHGIVDVTTTDGETWVAAVDAGFLSVANNRISILAEHAEMSHDIDLERARADLERCKAEGADDGEALRRAESTWAEARIRAAERAS